MSAHSDGGPGSHRKPWFLVAIVLVALLARLGFLEWQVRRSPDVNALQFDDEQWYWRIAESIHAGNGIVGEFGHRAPRMPLYPGYLALFAGLTDGVLWAKRVQCLIGAGVVVLVYLTAKRAFGRPVASLAALVAALDPLLVGASSLLLTETTFVVLIAALTFVWWPLVFPESYPADGFEPVLEPPSTRIRLQSGWWLAFIALSIAATYTRPSSLIVAAAMLGLWLLVRRISLRNLAVAAGVLMVIVAGMLPWGYRNYRLTGDFCLLDHRAGISLYDGVGPQATGASDLGDIKDSPGVRDLPEAQWDAHFRRESWKSITADPLRIVRLAGVKMARMWSPVLNAQEYQSGAVRSVMLAWSTCFYLAAGAGFVGIIMVRKQFWVALALLTPSLVLSLVHSLYIGSVRYRLGAIPTLSILAAVGLWQAIQGLQRHQVESAKLESRSS